MPVTVNVNGLSVVHQESGGIATATVPDVCNTPSATGPVPIPYPNVALSADLVDGTTSVQIDGASAAILGSKFAKSTGDEAGVAGGVTSGTFAMEASFISFSPTVMLDGKPACRLTDKMLMNKGNTVCMGGVMQSPLPPDPPPALPPDTQCVEPEASKHCALRGVIVRCGHDQRKLELDLSKRDVHVLQVIGEAHQPDTLTVEWDGTCGYGHPDCPSVAVRDDEDWKPLGQGAGQIMLQAPSWAPEDDSTWLFTLLMGRTDFKVDRRPLTSWLCLGGDHADVYTGQWLEIQTFPEVEWKVDGIQIGYSHENAEKAVGKPKKKAVEKPKFDYDEKATWTIAGSGEIKYGGRTLALSLEAGQLADGVPLFGPLLSKVGWCATVLDSMGQVAGFDPKLTPRWPKWSLSGGAKLVELPGKPTVGWEGSFTFGFDPLFGVTVEVSILDWLIRMAGRVAAAAGAGPAGTMLAEALVMVRERLARGIGGKSSAPGTPQASVDIDIVLSVGGDIKGGLGVKFVDGESEVNSEVAAVEAGVDIKVEGRLLGQARVDAVTWRFEAAGGGKVGSMAAEGSDTQKPSRISGKVVPRGGRDPLAMDGKIHFSGLAVYYLLYLEVGARGGENKDEKGKADYGRSPKQKAPLTHKEEFKDICKLMAPWTWPEKRA